jgi:hypothetical protein
MSGVGGERTNSPSNGDHRSFLQSIGSGATLRFYADTDGLWNPAVGHKRKVEDIERLSKTAGSFRADGDDIFALSQTTASALNLNGVQQGNQFSSEEIHKVVIQNDADNTGKTLTITYLDRNNTQQVSSAIALGSVGATETELWVKQIISAVPSASVTLSLGTDSTGMNLDFDAYGYFEIEHGVALTLVFGNLPTTTNRDMYVSFKPTADDLALSVLEEEDDATSVSWAFETTNGEPIFPSTYKTGEKSKYYFGADWSGTSIFGAPFAARRAAP